MKQTVVYILGVPIGLTCLIPWWSFWINQGLALWAGVGMGVPIGIFLAIVMRKAAP